MKKMSLPPGLYVPGKTISFLQWSKKAVFLLYLHTLTLCSWSQELPASPVQEQQFEAVAARSNTAPEDDSFQQQLEFLRRHPVHLNTASAEDLKATGLLNEWQVDHFIQYRQLLGKLISIYELQAIPGWDVETIRQLLPYIMIKDEATVTESFSTRMQGGMHTMLFRFSQVLVLPKEYKATDSGTRTYSGSPLKIMMRYKYNYKNLLQFGWLGDKDAGEQFFKGSQLSGFDFNSFHFFMRKAGIIQSLAVGDFSVNLGQGLLQWQSQAFKKGSDVLSVKRQGPVLRPYNSAGEFNFHRGIGISLQQKKWELTLFGSFKKISAHLAIDTQHHTVFISSLLPSGYHRTQREIEQKNNVQQFAAGANWQYNTSRGHAGLNMIHYIFSLPFQPSEAAYDIFSLDGKTAANYSIDYSYTLQNVHFFGEAAIDERGHAALLDGLLMSVDATADITLVCRAIDRAYHSLYSNAFTERTTPVNEKGLYAGISLRPFTGWQVNGYADFFQFPWLQYKANRPAIGHDHLIAVTYTPNRHFEMYGRYKTEMKQENTTGNAPGMHEVTDVWRSSWRMQMSWQLSRRVSWKSRMELSWYHTISLPHAQTGFLYYMDMTCQSLLPFLSGNIRCQYAEAGGHDTRLYAYENDVLFSSSVPSFAGKSWRIYSNLHYSLNKALHLQQKNKTIGIWVRVAYSKYDNRSPGQDKNSKDHQLEIKGQILFEW